MLGMILAAYLIAIAFGAAWIRARRPASSRRATWIILPAVVPAIVSAAWLLAYASEADPALALALFLAYPLPACGLGVAACAGADLLAKKVRGA